MQDDADRSSSDLLTAKRIALLKIADDMLVLRNGHMHGLMGPSLGFLKNDGFVCFAILLLSYERKEGHHNEWWTASREAHSKWAELTSGLSVGMFVPM